MNLARGTPLRLPTRTKAKALDRYKSVLQKSLTCLSPTLIWNTAAAERGERGEFVLLLSDSPLRLNRLESEPLYFTATQNFHMEKDHRFTGEWKVKTDRYEYTLSFSPNLSPELLAWHWHPGSKPEPHLHAHLEGPDPRLDKVHLPTGRVAFEEIVRCLIQDLEVRPARQNWENVLRDTETRFKTYRTWK